MLVDCPYLKPMQVVSLYKGKQTSANLPYKVTFIIPQEGAKDIKLVAHLVSVHDHSVHIRTACLLSLILMSQAKGLAEGPL